MLKNKAIPFVFIYLIGAVLQLFCANINLQSFKFPVNAAVLGVLIIVIISIRKFNFRSLCNFLLDKFSFLATLLMLLFNFMVLGLVPQIPIEMCAEKWTFWVNIGVFQWTTSWIFVFPMLFLTLILIISLLETKWNFRNAAKLLLQMGALLLLIGMFWGAPDEAHYRTIITAQNPENKVYNNDKKLGIIPFSIHLKDFEVERYETGGVKEFKAFLTINDQNVISDEVLLVNHPLSYRGYDIYLMDYEMAGEQYLVTLKLIYQRWKIISYIGVLLLISGLLVFPFSNRLLKSKR